jgi:hypothetical protein
MKKLSRIVMVTIASLLMIGFFAVPVLKLREADMIIVILIGIALMIANFVEVLREKDD